MGGGLNEEPTSGSVKCTHTFAEKKEFPGVLMLSCWLVHLGSIGMDGMGWTGFGQAHFINSFLRSFLLILLIRPSGISCFLPYLHLRVGGLWVVPVVGRS
jgi:hypothetical protein